MCTVTSVKKRDDKGKGVGKSVNFSRTASCSEQNYNRAPSELFLNYHYYY